MIGICKLCDQERELQKSHSIGRSVFSRVLRPAKNNLVLNISPRLEKIEYTSDQWDTYQLCGGCEKQFNNNYENYSLNALRGKYPTIPKIILTNGVFFSNIDQLKVKHYFLSIMWRAAESNHPAYSGIEICPEVSEYFKNLFLNNQEISPKIYNVRIRAVRDNAGIIDMQGLQKIIIAPYMYKTHNNIVYEMLFEGWLVEIYFKKPNYALIKKKGFLNNKTFGLIIPYVDFLEIPSLMQSFVRGKYLMDTGKFKLR